MPWECDDCDREFNSWRACKQHMDAVDHWAWRHECETCTKRFATCYAAEQHMRTLQHYDYSYDCETCHLSFRCRESRDDHQSDETHYSHLHCKPCDRYFQNANNLRQHQHSRTHQGAQVSCPFCTGAFTSASGLSHHLETSSCPNAPGLNRNQIHQTLRRRDPSGVITERLLEYHDSSIDPEWDAYNAWTGNGFECYLCRRVFGQEQGLRQHLMSPVHQAPLYHCPNARCRGKRFPSLAALFNHLESEKCGYTKFATVNSNVNGFMTGRGQNLVTF